MSVRYIFNTSGDYVAFVQGKNSFNPDCEWLGFIVNGNEVYQTEGAFIGYLLDDDRIAKKKGEPTKPRRVRPLRPLRPLTPLRRLRMPRLPYPYEDIFEGAKTIVTKLTPHGDLSKLNSLEGAKIIAADNTYLGKISRDKYDAESIANEYGQYGSPYNPHSIFNQYGIYGGQYSALSPLNPYSTTPPRLTKGSQLVGYLTANPYLQGRIDVNDLLNWLRSD